MDWIIATVLQNGDIFTPTLIYLNVRPILQNVLSQLGFALITFAITNIDDLLILSMYFANPTYKARAIVVGQYLGIIAIIVISFVGLILGAFLPDHWISFLGVIPLALGIKGLVQLREGEETGEESSAAKSRFQFLNVALVTIANGGDNVGVYAPLFANLEIEEIAVFVIVFLVLTAVWCVLSYYITTHGKVRQVFEKHGKVILPVFLMLLGLFIMKEFWIWALSI